MYIDCEGNQRSRMSPCQLYTKSPQTRDLLTVTWPNNARHTLHDFSRDFHSPTVLWKSATNAQNQRPIIKDRIWGRQLLVDACEIFSMLNIWTCQQLRVWDVFWLKTTPVMTYSQWESTKQGKGKHRWWSHRSARKITSTSNRVKLSQVTFIYIARLTIQIVTKQLHNIKIVCQ